MAGIEPKKEVCQELGGSPAQIWEELSDLATLIFGSIRDASVYGELCLDLLDTAPIGEGAPAIRGFKSPSAECSVAHTTQHNTTQHNATI